ncbi:MULTISPECIES: class I adenylate-forming enzyme family protein [unclassified Streptomyces]|uniref:class I adenylate-forming enzyme family protein n=1 Tax=unclassified Streptomyces TaxID=2593676 RepID=UPI002DD8AE53|nr:class I adenylate-forming enzyme family protein [Streptomyces sp. NBC_01775]WSB80515.1 acyl--CoA ligase [Streptomyces sp. NBC_01775]WSS39988.1 acyl--CoA ligase [Streptomyces sp. NBC_01187]
MRQVVREFQRKADEADFVAVIDDTGAHTARELLGEATGLAGALADGRAGGTCGTVMVQADNSWRTVVATLAVGMSGGVLAVVNRHTTPAEFTAAREDISPDAVIAEDSAMEEWAVPEALPGPTSTVLKGWSCRTAPGKRDVSRWSGGVLIGLTSGSTGRPKGVVQSEEALRYACTSTIAVNGLARGDAIAAIVPLSSTAAYCFGVYLSLLLGGPLLLTGKWDRAVALRRMAENDARWTMCVPTMALQMGAEAAGSGILGGVRAITVGGGPMDRAALARAEQSLGTKILRVFGMSECLGHTSPSPGDPEEIRLGRDGRPFPGTDVRALTPDGQPAGTGTTGRAQVRGPSLFLGYARDGGVHPPALTDDGYFATGDLLMTHEDGTLSIMGREKDVIIRGGRNIDITEIERAVAGHPRVARACVAAVPDEVLGERVALLVVTEDGGGIELDEVTGHLESAGLAKTKWPEYVWGVSELPQTRVGKLDRAGARDLAFRMRARTAGPAA